MGGGVVGQAAYGILAGTQGNQLACVCVHACVRACMPAVCAGCAERHGSGRPLFVPKASYREELRKWTLQVRCSAAAPREAPLLKLQTRDAAWVKQRTLGAFNQASARACTPKLVEGFLPAPP